jgi:CubicO group peptidase (beta-lactamase class C family)
MKKTIRYTLLGLLSIFILLNLIILISGKGYLYKGISATYLRGQSGPGIYDTAVFYNAEITTDNVDNWNYSLRRNILLDTEKSTLSEVKTTSFLVVHRGRILLEEYFENHTEFTRSNSFSMAKSIVALLIGIMKDEGVIKSLDDPISDYLPHIDDSYVTIRHLLAMTSGMQWDESGKNPLSDNAAAYYGKNIEEMMRNAVFSYYPDKKFYYASGNTQMLAKILFRATGQKVSELAETYIWQKIGAEKNALWSLSRKDGMEKAFCCFYATTRDFARIGQLILNNGKWNNQTIIQEETLNELTNHSTSLGGDIINHRYGLHFWIVDHPEHKIVYARGILGQYIIVIPDLDVVIVRTGHERKDKFSVPLAKDGKKPENFYLDDHPEDLFEYIAIAKRMLRN